MFRNYLKIAWRNLIKNKLYGGINICGLAVGMTVSFILLLYVWQELQYDQFHPKKDRIYLVFKNQSANGEIRTNSHSPEPLAAALKTDFPAVEQTARMNQPENSLISYRDEAGLSADKAIGLNAARMSADRAARLNVNKAIKLPTVAADSTITELFQFDFVAGSKQTALAGQSGIVLTRSAATAIFGSVENAVGKTITFNNQFPLTVTAIIEDHPVNSSFQFSAMISWKAFEHQRPWMKDAGWGNFLYETYVLLKPGTTPATAGSSAGAAGINEKLGALLRRYDPGDKDIRLFLYPFSRLHLYNTFRNGVNAGGRIGYVRLFLVLAIGILLMACINFMNLATARSAKRAREVGVRKTMGAQRVALIGQFLGESLTLSFLALLIACALTAIVIPLTNRLLHLQLTIPFDKWPVAVVITVLAGLAAGSYPAFFLSSFNPVKVLKGQLQTTGVKPRQLLVVVQFTFAISLILVSIFIYRQIGYLQHRQAGYDRSGLIQLPVEGNMQTVFESFRREAIERGAIVDAAMTSSAITDNKSSTWGIQWPDQLPGEDKIPVDCMAVTWHFLDTYGLKLVEGRDFDPQRPADSATVILNQAAVRLMRLKQPLHQQITWQGEKRRIIGVVQDFVWGSPAETVKPAIIGFAKDWVGNIGIRIRPGQSLSRLQDLYKKYNPAYPFQYTFTDEEFAKKYSDEQLLGAISVSFTSLAVLIACLGLFGLAAFSAEQRTREIGLRKILGASVSSIVFSLSKDFFTLILIAFVIASAVSSWCVSRWLDQYTYHTSFNGMIFVLTLLGSIVLCLVAVGWQAVRSARANPVESLRSE